MLKKNSLCFFSLILCIFIISGQISRAAGGYTLYQIGETWAPTPIDNNTVYRDAYSSIEFCGYDAVIDANRICLYSRAELNNYVETGNYEGPKLSASSADTGALVINHWEWDGLGVPSGAQCGYSIGDIEPYASYNRDYATNGWGYVQGHVETNVSEYPTARANSKYSCTMTHIADTNEYELGHTMRGYCTIINAEIEHDVSENYSYGYGIFDEMDLYGSASDSSGRYYACFGVNMRYGVEVANSIVFPGWQSICEICFAVNNYRNNFVFATSNGCYHAYALAGGYSSNQMNITWNFREFEDGLY